MINDIHYDNIKIGDRAELSKTITENDIEKFAELSLDCNPIHLDEKFAESSRFGKRIAHGMLTASLISAVIGTIMPGKNTIYLGQNIKFKAPVFISDTITAKVEVKEKKEKGVIILETIAVNQNGELVIEGNAIVMKEK